MERFLDNRRRCREEIARGKDYLSSRFTSLIATLTSRCNIRCIMCNGWNGDWSMPGRTVAEIVDHLPFLEHVIWQGGEVFLFPPFAGLLEETRKYPYLEQRITTNALLIDDRWIEKLAQNNVELICSIDAATRETYERIRRGAAFGDLLRSLALLREARRRGNGIVLRMNVVVMRSNYRELEPLLDMAAEYGFENMLLLDMKGEPGDPENIYTGESRNAGILEELRRTVDVLQAKARGYRMDLFDCLPLPVNGPGRNPEERGENAAPPGGRFCHLPWQQAVVGTFGHVQFGCWCPTYIGNISHGTLGELWNSEEARRYRREIVGGRYAGTCDRKCVEGIVSRNLRVIDEFEKRRSRAVRREQGTQPA